MDIQTHIQYQLYKQSVIAAAGPEKPLYSYGYNAFSAHEEDGILTEIFARTGSHSRTFIEFSLFPNYHSVSLNLLLQGWRGLWVTHADNQKNPLWPQVQQQAGKGLLKILLASLPAQNIDQFIQTQTLSPFVDLLIMDFPRNNYWLWRAIECIQASVVVIPYNAIFHPPINVNSDYQDGKTWDSSQQDNLSLHALEKLANAKDYRLVGCNISGNKAFFVRHDLVKQHFGDNFSAAYHFRPSLFPIDLKQLDAFVFGASQM